MADVVLIMPLANRYDKITVRIPNGLLAIASLPVKRGLDVKIIDLKTDKNWHQTLRSSIGGETICAGIACSTGRMIKSALSVAKKIRAINPELPIVWGGPHPTLMPEQTLQHDLVDIVVINEGDITFDELVKALAGGKDLSSVSGIGYKENGIVKINSPRPLIKDLNSLPPFPYYLLDISKYSSLNIDDLPSIDILTSRGCPYNCGFCSTPLTSQRKWRAYSVENVLKNISFLYKNHRLRTFYFVEDNFMVDLERIEKILDGLKERDLKIYWGTQGVRVDTILRMTEKLLNKIEESGCRELSIGVESANPGILKMIDKKITTDDIVAVNKKLTGRKFAVKYNMMIGFPGEDIESIKNTVELAVKLQKQNKNAWYPFNIFTPFPGTPMFNKARESGFREPGSLEGWSHLEAVGWDKYFKHWMNKKDNSLLKSINCTSYVAFPIAIQKISNPFLRTLFKIYQPFAYFRFKNFFYFMHLEKLLLEERY